MGDTSGIRPSKLQLLSALKGIGIVLGAILTLVFVVVVYLDASRPGQLTFSQESVDVGQLPVGQAVVYRFTMRNTGTGPVTITKKTAAALEGC